MNNVFYVQWADGSKNNYPFLSRFRRHFTSTRRKPGRKLVAQFWVGGQMCLLCETLYFIILSCGYGRTRGGGNILFATSRWHDGLLSVTTNVSRGHKSDDAG